MTVRRPHHREGGPDILESDQISDRGPFDRRLALELEAQFREERLGGFEIIDNDENVVHPYRFTSCGHADRSPSCASALDRSLLPAAYG